MHVPHMHKKMIQIRHVPEALHKKLKARAAMAGMPLSDYLLQEIRRVAEQPTIEELVERIRQLPPVEPSVPAARAVREDRDSR